MKRLLHSAPNLLVAVLSLLVAPQVTPGSAWGKEPAAPSARSDEDKATMPAEITRCEGFSEGIAVVFRGDRCGCIDKTGNLVVPLEYEAIVTLTTTSAGGRLVAALRNGRWGVFDRKGRPVVPHVLDREPCGFVDGHALVKKDGKYGMLNAAGQITIPCQYDGLDPASEGLASFTRGRRRGFVDVTGSIAFLHDYDTVSPFSGGIPKVMKDGKYGFVDPAGNPVCPCELDAVSGSLRTFQIRMAMSSLPPPYEFDPRWDFHDGMLLVSRAAKSGFVDTTGRLVIPCEFDSVHSPFSEGLVAVAKDGHWGYLDKRGGWAIRPYVDGVDPEEPAD